MASSERKETLSYCTVDSILKQDMLSGQDSKRPHHGGGGWVVVMAVLILVVGDNQGLRVTWGSAGASRRQPFLTSPETPSTDFALAHLVWEGSLHGRSWKLIRVRAWDLVKKAGIRPTHIGIAGRHCAPSDLSSRNAHAITAPHTSQ
jgi:hypothetical protein